MFYGESFFHAANLHSDTIQNNTFFWCINISTQVRDEERELKEDVPTDVIDSVSGWSIKSFPVDVWCICICFTVWVTLVFVVSIMVRRCEGW